MIRIQVPYTAVDTETGVTRSGVVWADVDGVGLADLAQALSDALSSALADAGCGPASNGITPYE